MKAIHYILDVAASIYAIGIAFGLFDVPSDRIVAVAAFWALSEGFRSGWKVIK